MNKKLLFLPLLAVISFAAVSCGEDEGPVEPADSAFDLADLEMLGQATSFVDTDDEDKEYKIHEGAPVDGGEYYFGFESTHNGSNMYFFHGGPHTDSAGTYDFFLGCKPNSVKGCAKIKIHYVDDIHFTMKVVANTGEGYQYDGVAMKTNGDYYDDYFIEFKSQYNQAKRYQTTSIVKTQNESDLGAGGKFSFRYMVGDSYIYAPCSYMQNADDALAPNLEFKGFGTYGKYESIGCISQGNMTQDAQYIARFWEPAE